MQTILFIYFREIWGPLRGLSFLSSGMSLLPNRTAWIPKTHSPISFWFIKRHWQQLKLYSEADAVTRQNADCTETKRGSSFKQSPGI
jgi:hypothetical protein